MRNIRFLSFFTTVISINTALGQQIVDDQLKHPIANAIETNYDIKNKYIEIEKNQYQIAEVKGILKPDVSAIALGGYFSSNGLIDLPTKTIPLVNAQLFSGNQKFSTSSGFGTIGVNATQVIFSGLQVPNAIKAIEQKNLAFEYLADAEKETIAKEVAQTFDQLMLLDKVQDLITNSTKRLNKEHLKVQKAIQNGLAIPYDREKIKLAMLELDAKQVEIDGTKKLLYAKLAVLTHLAEDILEPIHYELSPIDLLANDYTLENKKELKALEHSVQAYEFLYKKEKGAHLPQVFAFAGTNYTSLFASRFKMKDVGHLGDVTMKMDQFNLFPNILVGVGAKWELFDGGQHKNKLAQAKSDIEVV